MPIRAYQVPRREITDAEGEVLADVRGLACYDLNLLVSLHFDSLDKLLSVWEHYQDVSKRKDPGAMMTDADFAAFLADICASASSPRLSASKTRNSASRASKSLGNASSQTRAIFSARAKSRVSQARP